jgi:hypothetical protein
LARPGAPVARRLPGGRVSLGVMGGRFSQHCGKKKAALGQGPPFKLSRPPRYLALRM